MDIREQFIEDLQVVENISIGTGRIDPLEFLDMEFHLSNYADSARRLGIKEDVVSLRQVINCFSDFLTKARSMSNYLDVKKLSTGYPTNYLLFDYCLAVLEGDVLDARFYLAHAYRIMGFSRSINLILSSLISKQLLNDMDVRTFLALLANSIEPASARSYVESFGEEYQNRYAIYRKELQI